MTAVDERLLKRGEERRLIFVNVANGVPVEKVMAAFSRSEAEIWREVEYVGKKIREARFRTKMPPVDAIGLKAIRHNRVVLLETLRQLKSEYLASDLILPRIGVQAIDSPQLVKEASGHLAEAVRRMKEENRRG